MLSSSFCIDRDKRLYRTSNCDLVVSQLLSRGSASWLPLRFPCIFPFQLPSFSPLFLFYSYFSGRLLKRFRLFQLGFNGVYHPWYHRFTVAFSDDRLAVCTPPQQLRGLLLFQDPFKSLSHVSRTSLKRFNQFQALFQPVPGFVSTCSSFGFNRWELLVHPRKS